MYPRNFFFAVSREGIDGRRSLLDEGRGAGRRRKPSISSRQQERRRLSLSDRGTDVGLSSSKADVAVLPMNSSPRSSRDGEGQASSEDREPIGEDAIDDLTGAMSALRFVPSSVRFGRGGRPGFSRW